MNIGFIQWMCDKADGFDVSLNNNAVSVNGRMRRPFEDWQNDQDWHIVYPLLLQRAIEGVNRATILSLEGFLVDINCSDIAVYNFVDCRRKSFEHDSISYDQAKESALMYIYKQEKLS